MGGNGHIVAAYHGTLNSVARVAVRAGRHLRIPAQIIFGAAAAGHIHGVRVLLFIGLGGELMGVGPLAAFNMHGGHRPRLLRMSLMGHPHSANLVPRTIVRICQKMVINVITGDNGSMYIFLAIRRGAIEKQDIADRQLGGVFAPADVRAILVLRQLYRAAVAHINERAAQRLHAAGLYIDTPCLQAGLYKLVTYAHSIVPMGRGIGHRSIGVIAGSLSLHRSNRKQNGYQETGTQRFYPIQLISHTASFSHVLDSKICASNIL